MKIILKIACILALFTVFSAAALAAEQSDSKKYENKIKVLVVYYSWSGNTRTIAELIQKETGGDIFEIQTDHVYPERYNTLALQAKKEIEDGFKPAVKNKVSNINAYDIIFVGTPVWWNSIPPPVTAFLGEHDLSGKTVVPFVSYGGGDTEQCFKDIEKLIPNSKVLPGEEFLGSGGKKAGQYVSAWIEELGFKTKKK